MTKGGIGSMTDLSKLETEKINADLLMHLEFSFSWKEIRSEAVSTGTRRGNNSTRRHDATQPNSKAKQSKAEQSKFMGFERN